MYTVENDGRWGKLREFVGDFLNEVEKSGFPEGGLNPRLLVLNVALLEVEKNGLVFVEGPREGVGSGMLKKEDDDDMRGAVPA